MLCACAWASFGPHELCGALLAPLLWLARSITMLPGYDFLCTPRSFLAQNPADLLRPLGLNEDGRNFPLSPKSERAYTRISREFDVLFQALQAENDVNQNMPVRANSAYCGWVDCAVL